jgi:hypothetical protein
MPTSCILNSCSLLPICYQTTVRGSRFLSARSHTMLLGNWKPQNQRTLFAVRVQRSDRQIVLPECWSEYKTISRVRICITKVKLYSTYLSFSNTVLQKRPTVLQLPKNSPSSKTHYRFYNIPQLTLPLNQMNSDQNPTSCLFNAYIVLYSHTIYLRTRKSRCTVVVKCSKHSLLGVELFLRSI